MNSNWTLMNYRELKKQIKNAVSELGTVLELKGVVADTSKLPLTGNKKGDVYIVFEDNTEYVWTSDNASGLITDYEELGPVIIGKPFIVTLTPTAADYSGTMDKTVAEINEAYLSGQRIVFSISALGMNVEFPLVDANKSDNYVYPSFDAVLWNVIDNVFMHVSTSFTDYGNKDTYAVSTFPMTYDSANGVSF